MKEIGQIAVFKEIYLEIGPTVICKGKYIRKVNAYQFARNVHGNWMNNSL